jgi:hypothetical protein
VGAPARGGHQHHKGDYVGPCRGSGGPDAGTSSPDAGTGNPDAGTGNPDAGTGNPDAGTGDPDTCIPASQYCGGGGTCCAGLVCAQDVCSPPVIN